jgi:hypothetical protein
VVALKFREDRADPTGMDLSAIALRGLQQAEGQLEQAATRIALSAGSPGRLTLDAVDLSAQMVALLSAKELASVNLQTLRTADEVAKNVIDMLA